MFGRRSKRVHAQGVRAGRDANVAGRDLIINELSPIVVIAAVAILVAVIVSAGVSLTLMSTHASTNLSGTQSAAAKPSSAQASNQSSPVVVAIRKVNAPCDGEWVTSKPLSELPKTPSAETDDWTPWVRAVGAADVSSTYVTVTIQGTSSQIVELTGIIFNLKRNSPIRGPRIGPECGSQHTGAYVSADLDQNPPRITESSSDPNAVVGVMPNVYKPLELPYSISKTDDLVLTINGNVNKYYAVWSVDILWSSDGKNGTIHIDDDGVPFKTSPWQYATTMVSCVGCPNP
jgi:hypothetical protein